MPRASKGRRCALSGGLARRHGAGAGGTAVPRTRHRRPAARRPAGIAETGRASRRSTTGFGGGSRPSSALAVDSPEVLAASRPGIQRKRAYLERLGPSRPTCCAGASSTSLRTPEPSSFDHKLVGDQVGSGSGAGGQARVVLRSVADLFLRRYPGAMADELDQAVREARGARRVDLNVRPRSGRYIFIVARVLPATRQGAERLRDGRPGGAARAAPGAVRERVVGQRVVWVLGRHPTASAIEPGPVGRIRLARSTLQAPQDPVSIDRPRQARAMPAEQRAEEARANSPACTNGTRPWRSSISGTIASSSGGASSRSWAGCRGW